MSEQEEIGDRAGSVGERRSRIPWIVGAFGLVVLLIGGLIFVGSRVLAPKEPVAAAAQTSTRDPRCEPGAVKVTNGKPASPNSGFSRLPAPVVTLQTGCEPPEAGTATAFAEVLVGGEGPEFRAGEKFLICFAIYDLDTGTVLSSIWESKHQYDGFTTGSVATGDWTAGLLGMKPGGRRVLIVPAATAGKSLSDPVALHLDKPLAMVVDLVGRL